MKVGIGLGISFGARASGGGAAVFDPATLALTQWYRASYAGSPWSPTASAGASGTNGDLTEASFPPTTGTAVNGLTPATFDGVAERLQSTKNNNQVYSASALSGWCLFKANTVDAADLSEYKDGQLFADIANAETVVGVTSDGAAGALLHLGFYAGGYVEHDIACSVGAWVLGQWKLESGQLKARVNSGSWSSKACGNLSFLTPGAMAVGKGFGAGTYFDGDMLEIAAAAVAFSDADFDDVVSYVNATYGLSL